MIKDFFVDETEKEHIGVIGIVRLFPNADNLAFGRMGPKGDSVWDTITGSIGFTDLQAILVVDVFLSTLREV